MNSLLYSQGIYIIIIVVCIVVIMNFVSQQPWVHWNLKCASHWKGNKKFFPRRSLCYISLSHSLSHSSLVDSWAFNFPTLSLKVFSSTIYVYFSFLIWKFNKFQFCIPHTNKHTWQLSPSVFMGRLFTLWLLRIHRFCKRL